ncbi:MAG: hypothetical protein P9L92_08450 [Candidatus Electryonea clarkiae]|nr:hypothetical protein [Candidatus Electryonea clarkiae]MDP8285743.1 hypothetical protein [Candidatus Electryonea clarkiae]
MSGTFIFVLASSVAQILVARMVGVENMGIVKVAIIFENYSAFLSFGLGFGLSRQLPLMLGRGESDSARELLNTVWQWFNLVRV